MNQQRFNESRKQWTDESMKRCFSDSMTQCRWFSESMKQCTSELASRWQWIPDSQWITEPTSQWIHKSMNQWINEPMNEGLDGWINGIPLRWGTSSELPLIWATCALRCLSADSFVASATQVFSSPSCYNVFSSLQLLSRIAQESSTMVKN